MIFAVIITIIVLVSGIYVAGEMDKGVDDETEQRRKSSRENS